MAINHNIEILWLGHAAFRITSPNGTVILTDPFHTGNPATPVEHRVQENVNLILPSHGHGDNFADTMDIANRTGATTACIYEIGQYLERQGVKNVISMNIGGTIAFKDLHVTMTPAWHSSSIADGDQLLPGGTACGFVITFGDGYTIYFSGDTAAFLDMQLIAKLRKPDLAILSIGDHFTMGPKGAAEAIRMLGVKSVIPMHYGTFPMLTGTPEQLRVEASDIDGLEIHVLEPGESLRV
ncbi:MAG TPA: metal-dependent hydrolase [Chloroflexota bacterium]|jgi:L-ascorbate metabolism protein UlaG (beta-lactamase superfamily)|nr:metal-dependent hydrolase [Chloroflexota bacterium]